MKTIPIELKNYNRRVDDSVSLLCESLIEVSSKDIAEIDSYRGMTGIVVLTDTVVGNEVEIDIDEILKNIPENDARGKYKSPSGRFRSILWRLYEQDLKRRPTEEEFAKYYQKEYNKICEHYKNKFSDDIYE